MKNGSGVCDFKDEDELPEFTAGKILDKLKNPSLDNPAILKYEFLECVAQGTDVQKKEIGNVPRVDIDAIDCDQSCDDAFTSAPPGTGEEDIATKEGNTGLDVAIESNSMSCEQNPCVKEDNDESGSYHPELKSRDSCPEATSPGKCLFDCSLPDCPSSNEPVDMISNADETMNESSPSSPASETAEDGVSLNGHLSDHCSGDVEMDDTVVLHPDYVEYCDNHYTGFMASFSHCGIKIMDSTACGNQGTFSFETGIDDIIDIRCHWFQRMGLVNVKLRILSKDAVQDDTAHGVSGIQGLKFAVVEPCWSAKQEAITSLNMKYLALWNVMLDEDIEMDGDKPFTRKCYLPNFDEPFEDVIYPKGDIDAVSISKRDVDLLQPETFINDTIIDFYIKYLKNQIPPEDKHKYHFFNSFFFRKLADLDKDPSSISDGRAAFLRVHKWTKKVDIFGKDYVFIPVNFSLHWSLIVICHPGEVACFKDESLDKSVKVPCILHMDSIKGSHAGLKNLVQRYLWEEWKERHKETSEDISSKFLNLRFVPLELPQQENSFDCGLFLLHYLELFLAEAPENFSPFKITKLSNFLNVNWFPPSEVSLKRALIQRLIFELLENRSRAVTSAVCSDEPQSSKFPDNNKNEMGVEFMSEKCSPTIACHGNLSTSEAGQGIEMTLLAEASMRNVQSVNESGLVLREFFEPGATAASLLGQYQSYDQPSSYYHLSGAISPREEDVETGGEFVYLPSGESGFQQISGITPQVGSISYTSRGFGTSWNPGISMQGEHNTNSSPETSCSSDNSEDIGIIENVPVGEDLGPSHEEGTDHQRSPSVETMECLTEGPASAPSGMLETSTVECLQAPDKLQDSNGNGELFSGEDNPTILVHQETNMLENSLYQDSETEIAENREVACDDLKMIGNDCLAELHEQPAAKRLRLTPLLEGDEEFAGSLSKDLHL